MLALAFLEGAAAFFFPVPLEEELSAFFGAACVFAVFAILTAQGGRSSSEGLSPCGFSMLAAMESGGVAVFFLLEMTAVTFSLKREKSERWGGLGSLSTQ